MQRPQGRPLSQLLRQLWKEQETYALNIIRQTDGLGTTQINLNLWFNAFLERIKPLYQNWLRQGQVNMAQRLERKINERQKKAIVIPHRKNIFSTIFGQFALEAPNADEPSDEDVFNIYNPEAVKFINSYSYLFAQSTNATTKLRLDVAYKRFQQKLTQGIERGQSLKDLTGEVQRIFRDPARAMMIAATEASRAYGAGRKIAAEQSGVCYGLKWLASSDACPICLGLNGKVVRFNEPFAVIGRGAYSVVYHEPAHPHCFCVTNEVLNEEWRVAA
jgi:SPP1 gp7 family putative phage head morphogenesis protein